MRVATLSIDFGLLLLVLVALFHTQGAIADSNAACVPENCRPAKECETRAISGSCEGAGNVCCSLVKREFRNRCRQWGGECIKDCPRPIRRAVTDCAADQSCCVWL